MSRDYARGLELHDLSQFINGIKLQKYHEDKRKIKLEDIDAGCDYIEPFISREAQTLLENNPITVKTKPFDKITKVSLIEKGEPTLLTVPSFGGREEYKNELLFILGEIMAVQNDDKEMGAFSYDVQGEYRSVIGFLLQYIYMRAIDRKEDYFLKILTDLRRHNSMFLKQYNQLDQKVKNSELLLKAEMFFPADVTDRAIKAKEANLKAMGILSRWTLNPFSSFDATLQFLDVDPSDENIRDFIEALYQNETGNRSDIMRELGIDTIGFKRLRKEYERFKR